MAENNPTPQTAKPAAKPRNPVEKVIVRGFIAVMLVLVAIEGVSKWQHHQVLAALSTKMKAVDEVPDSPPVTMADVKKVLGSKQPRTEKLEGWNNHVGANHVDVYSWFTFSPVNKREIYVFYWKKLKKEGAQQGDDDLNPEVLAVQVDDRAPPEPPKVAGEQPGAAEGGGPGMMRPPMMPDGMRPPSAGRMGPGGAGPAGRPGGASGEQPPAGDAATETPDADKADADKSAEEKAGDEKPNDAEGDKDQQ